ncbi:MAG: NADH dehydrogenase [Candidatus Roseilinea sp.]|nr:MAG: NADH dehydrogenase [Candidatus Roseilinea sp.]
MQGNSHLPRVVIVGAGFGGLKVAQHLRRAPVAVTLVDARNHHIFQPLLYQVATAALNAEEIAQSVRGLFHGYRNFDFRMVRATDVDWDGKCLRVDGGEPIPFDYLVLAAGAVTSDFGVEGVAQYAFGLKSVEEAIALRSHILKQFECANNDPAQIEQGALTVVVVGGGPTGVEMAGAIVEWFKRLMPRDFPRLDVSRAHVVLIEAMDRLLAPFDASLQQNALDTLRRFGVEVRLNETVTRVTADAVHLKSGEVIPARTVVWAAGMKASPLAQALGVALGRGGRIVVNPDMSIPGHPDAFVIGDLALGKNPDGTPHPQLAQAALQGGKHVARQIQRRIRGQPTEPFIYRDPGTMATIGRSAAVAQFPNGWKFTGFFAWLMWLFLHLIYLIGLRNRLSVFLDWVWHYFTYDRSARLLVDLAMRRTCYDSKDDQSERDN